MLLPYLNKDLIEAGCDEAGRGCLAGAVYAAAVILPTDFKNELLNDSKQLTEKQRDGSVGAAKGAGISVGIYKDNNEAFATLEKLEVIEPKVADRQAYADAYARWKHWVMC